MKWFLIVAGLLIVLPIVAYGTVVFITIHFIGKFW